MLKFGLIVWQSLIHQQPQCSSPMLAEEPSGGSKRALNLYTISFWPKWRMQGNCQIHCFHNWREMKRDGLLTAQHCMEPEWQESGQNKEKVISRGSSSFCPVKKTRQRLVFSVQPLKNHSHIRGTGSGIFYSFNLLTFGSYCSYILLVYLSSLPLLWWWWRWWGFACMNVCDPCACVALRGQKRALTPLDLVERVVSCHVSAHNQA